MVLTGVVSWLRSQQGQVRFAIPGTAWPGLATASFRGTDAISQVSEAFHSGWRAQDIASQAGFVIIEGILKIDFFAGGSEWKELRRFPSFLEKGPFPLLEFYNMQPCAALLLFSKLCFSLCGRVQQPCEDSVSPLRFPVLVTVTGLSCSSFLSFFRSKKEEAWLIEGTLIPTWYSHCCKHAST